MSDNDKDSDAPVNASTDSEDSQGDIKADSFGDDVTFDDGNADSGDDAFDQSDIDDLFGVDTDDLQSTAGIYALLNSELIRHRRLPLLEACFDRLVHALTKSLRTFTSGNAELSLVDTSSVRFGNYIEAVPQPALISVFKTVEWNEYGLVNIDCSLIYAIIDVLLGGRRSGTSLAIETRPFTTIETTLIKRMIALILEEMTKAFKPLTEVEFRYERIESNPSLVEISPPTNIAILLKIDVTLDDRAGRIEILIPYATLEPIRDLLQQMFMGEKFGQDSIWESHLVGQMHLTDVELDVTFVEQAVPLGEVLALEIGSTLKLRSKPQDPVILRCGTTPLLEANVGRVGDNMAIKVADWLGSAHHTDSKDDCRR